MKKLFCAMASIALATSPVAIAQPGHQQDYKNEHRSVKNQHGPDREAARRQAANRIYNAGTYRAYNYGYANPAHYRSDGVHHGWAQDRGNSYHWSAGERMGYNDWYYAPRVRYRRYHLRRPPYGYEWRRYSDRYVLVAITSGLIMSVILDAGR
jgi:Ni/Co efflux regulator RcnB